MIPIKPRDWRPCGDYRPFQPNHRSQFLPPATAVIVRAPRQKIFSKLDLVKPYHQIPMHPDDIEKTAITSTLGLFGFLCMPSGLKNDGKTFQLFISDVTNGFRGVFGDFDYTLVARTTELFTRLEKFGLRNNFRRCSTKNIF